MEDLSSTESVPAAVPSSKKRRIILVCVILLVFSLGIGIRLIQLTNPPLDFHAWRQLRSASIARGFFYRMEPAADPLLRQKAIEIGNSYAPMEPPVFEWVVALTYRLVGQELLWISRLYAILFWSIGGIGLFLLARRLTSTEGAVVSLAIYLLLPFGIYASRSFQPDPLMVMWIIWAIYALYRWSESQTMRWAIAAGLLSGIAVFTKAFAVYPIAITAIILTLTTWPLKKAIRQPQVWVAGALMVLIPGIYYFLIMGQAGPGYIKDWIVSFSGLLRQGWFYKRWLDTADNLIGIVLVLISAAAILILPGKKRLLMVGMWLGYILIGLSVPELIISHSYYNLYAVPLVALSMAPIAQLFIDRLGKERLVWKIAFLGIAAVGIFFTLWNVRVQLVKADYRSEIMGWIKIGRELPQGAKYIGITHDYNQRLQYYGWTLVQGWPQVADQQMGVLAGGNMDVNDPSWNSYFKTATAGYDYFIVTSMNELDAQPMLKANLSKYPSIQGDGYVLYDLRQK